jgi:hypothetical protein
MFTGLLFRSLCELLWAPSVGSEETCGAFRDTPKTRVSSNKSRAAVDNRRNFNVLKARS